ncbi:DUF2142 domain-containing protein [Microbacterium pumilum]|uniref:Glycosyltransferase RgtA/B/C/D-like domain-containing protein n=1 Tax=Microbacterium pumilum TaxID=344165 RepID=A0ABN2SEB9_9MICO
MPSEGAYRLAVIALTLVMLSGSVLWALVRPPFSGPDELIHYNSVVRVVAGGGWPLPYTARVTDSTVTAAAESGNAYGGQGMAVLPAPDDRSLLLEGDTWQNHGRDQMLQHPPGYYYLLAGVVVALGGPELRWDHAQLAIRMASGVLLAASVPFLVGTARRVTRSRRAGLAGGASALFVAYFANMGGLINNDTLLITACSASIYFVVRARTSVRARAVLLAASGIALGVALLTKGLALLLIPVIVLLAVVAVARLEVPLFRKALLILLPAAIAFVIGGWWWVRNLILLGKVQPNLLGNRAHRDIADPAYSLTEFLQSTVLRLNRTFWSLGLPDLYADIAGVILLAAIVVAIIVSRERATIAILWLFPGLVVVTIMLNAHSIFWDTGDPARGIQGRYLFCGIAALCVTVGCLAQWVARPLGPRARRFGSATFCVAAAAATFAAIAYVFVAEWGAGSSGVETSATAHGISTLWYSVVPILGLLALAGLVTVLLVSPLALDGDREPLPVEAGTAAQSLRRTEE